MTFERYIWTIVSILFVLLTIEFTGVVEAKVAYEQDAAAHQANVIRYEHSRDRLERHFNAVRERTAVPVVYTDFAELIGEETESRTVDEPETDPSSIDEEADTDVPEVPDSEAVPEVPLAEAAEKPEPAELQHEETEPETRTSTDGPAKFEPEVQVIDTTDTAEIDERPMPETAEGDEFSAYESAVEVEIHRLTNAERTARGLEPLTYDEALAAIASSHSEDMAEHDYFDHDTPEGCDLACRFDDAEYAASAWAENIAWRMQTTLPGPEEIAEHFMTSWMDSTGHRENILRENLTHEGVGVARIGDTVYVTADFARPK